MDDYLRGGTSIIIRFRGLFLLKKNQKNIPKKKQLLLRNLYVECYAVKGCGMHDFCRKSNFSSVHLTEVIKTFYNVFKALFSAGFIKVIS